MQEVIITNWAFITGVWNGYTAPELRSQHIKGTVYNHPSPKFSDGKEVKTSSVQRVDTKTKRVQVTSGRTYLLTGPPDPEWVQAMKDLGMYDKVKELIEGSQSN